MKGCSHSKAEYRNESAWLICFPGDWHFLKNYQEVLIKIYYDAGLSELASAIVDTCQSQWGQTSNELTVSFWKCGSLRFEYL